MQEQVLAALDWEQMTTTAGITMQSQMIMIVQGLHLRGRMELASWAGRKNML